MLTIDGSYGEGGGQILRTSMSLSVILCVPIKVINIRTGRPKPGLSNQHLTCLNAVAHICNGILENAYIGSQTITFIPGEFIKTEEELVFDIKSAGSF